MKSLLITILLSVCFIQAASSQTLPEAKELYLKGEYAKALPTFEAEYNAKPTDANLNHWYGVCLYETGGSLDKAEARLLVASKKNIQDSFFYLGQIYTTQFRFTEANEYFDKYEALLKKKVTRRKKEDIDKHEAELARFDKEKKELSRLHRAVTNTEDIQVIDSIVVDKAAFLSAYKLSRSSGHIDDFNKVFTANKQVESTVYFTEKETKIYFGQPDQNKGYTLFSMEKLIDEYGNEKKLSANNFGLVGDLNYPFVMADGVTIYFAAKDDDSLGEYDLFVSRYNTNNDTFLAPERLSMPFNSQFNDYMMAVDEEKGVGWFASDRFQPEGKVCVYTFIPNKAVKVVESEEEKYIAGRALLSSIKQTWQPEHDYSQLIALARKAPKEEVKVARDFEFVINDQHTYYELSAFKNKVARDSYYKVVQLKSEYKALAEKLDKQRDTYATSSDDAKRNMTNDILKMENQAEQLLKDISASEIQARNQEIESLK